jgi:hypothetical protein
MEPNAEVISNEAEQASKCCYHSVLDQFFLAFGFPAGAHSD